MNKLVMLLMTKRYDTLEGERQHFKAVVDQLEKDGFDVEMDWAVGKNEDFVIERLQGAKVVYCSGNPPITRKVLENVPGLRLVQRNGIGFNSIDVDAAAELGIPVNYITGYCIEELAVHAIAMMLANMRSITSFDRRIRAGEWPKGKAQIPLRMSRLTAGIYGIGGSGYNTAKILHNGFGCRIIACDPFAKPEILKELDAELVGFDELLERSDLISVHAPLTKETFHIFNEDAFRKMKLNCIIATTARGGIIDETALYSALKEHRIMGAGLDVFENEPLKPGCPLLELDNIVLTPHSAYMGKEAMKTQNYISSVLPGLYINENTLYRRYLANPAVLHKLPDCTVDMGVLSD